ncbi:MAG: hypothetical protein AB8B95_15720 [Pseudohongiellaceae bacterium]
MPEPLPIRLTHRALKHLKYPAISLGVASFALLFGLYPLFAASVIDGQIVVFDDELELAGFFLIVSILPPYFLTCLVAGIRLSDRTQASLLAQSPLADRRSITERKSRLGRFWWVSVLFGLPLANINVDWSAIVFDPAARGFTESLAILSGNYLIWFLSSAMVYIFFLEGQAFHKIGQIVSINLYDLNQLNGFGRASLAGFLFAMVAMALSIFQSLDQDFSFGRYRQVLIVGIPAAVALTLLPSWSIHRRIRKRKMEHLAEIDEQIAITSSNLDDRALGRLNGLLARRAIVAGFRTWPMDFSTFARFILYVFIPPLAWAGAALMEIFLDTVLGT